MSQMVELVEMGLYIGVSGQSFESDRTCAMVREIPMDRIIIGSNSPFCDVGELTT